MIEGRSIPQVTRDRIKAAAAEDELTSQACWRTGASQPADFDHSASWCLS